MILKDNWEEVLSKKIASGFLFEKRILFQERKKTELNMMLKK